MAVTIETPQEQEAKVLLPRRYLIAWLFFFGMIHTSILRSNMSMAIVALTAEHSSGQSNETTIYPTGFNWSSEEKGLLLGSFYYGFTATQFLGGIMAPVVGAGRLFGFAVFISAVLSIVTPVAINHGLVYSILVRAVIGLAQGVVYPAVNEFWCHWGPPLESTRLLQITYSGTHIGIFTAMALSGWIADAFGWSWIFYFFGITGLLWCTIWFYIVSERPSEDKRLSQAELHYLSSTIKETPCIKFSDVPWYSILTSMPIWATIVANTTENNSYLFLITQTPMYLFDATGFALEELGILAALPYLVMAIVCQLGGYLSDMLRSRFHVENTTIRKLFTCGALAAQAVVLVALANVDSIPAVLGLIIFVVGIEGFSVFSINFYDLGPQYSSLTVGFSNTISNIPGITGPIITSIIVQNNLVSEWQTVFCLTAGVAIFGAVFYAVFGSGKIQPWAIQETTNI